MQEQISQHNHDALGCDGWEISAHAGSAPDHEPIQGKQYRDEVYTRLNDSLKRRIGTLNCGHSAMPIIFGVNDPQYTEKELEDFRQKNEEGVNIDGKKYTLYEATQRQRSIERSIRKKKHHILIDEELGDAEKLQQDQIRLQILKQEYHRFSKAANLPEQYERLEKAGFTWKHGKAAEKKAIAKPDEPSYNVQKLEYSGKTTPELEGRFEESLSRMPIKHRKLAESKITGIEITNSDIGSWYSRKTGKICLSEKASPDAAIHEYSHALADAVGAYADPKFKAIMRKGLEDISPADIIYDEETFKRPIYRIESNKFISKYQGRLYEEVGIYDGKNISLDGMLDYFSEGYEEYIRNPDNLKEHDLDLFVYFEGII